MPGIPEKLEEWNLDIVHELAAKGYFETDSFDFKEVLKASRQSHASYRKRLTQTSCAFANTSGGFLVFGVKDVKVASNVAERLAGIPNSAELAKEFGDQIAAAEPALHFIPQNPAISIPGGEKVIFVVHIPRSTRGPHIDSEGVFYKRTNRGNEPMSYSEIQGAFAQREERLAKVKLLYLILIDTWLRAQTIRDIGQRGDAYSLVIPDAGEIMRLLSDIYGLLPHDLPPLLLQIKGGVDVMATQIQLFYQQAVLPLTGQDHRTAEHNRTIANRAEGLQRDVGKSLEALEQQFGFHREITEEGGNQGFRLGGL